jgi:hypothetical protein
MYQTLLAARRLFTNDLELQNLMWEYKPILHFPIPTKSKSDWDRWFS